MLEMQQRDITSEIMWVAAGGVVGALPLSADAIYRYSQEPYIFTVPDLIQLFIFAGSVATWAVTAWLHHRHKKDRSAIFSKIRAQKKD